MTGYYIHDICGRLRVKIPLIKRNPIAASDARHLLEQIRGTQSITVNPMTGSIVIHYDPKAINSQVLLKKLYEAGYIEPFKAMTRDQYIYTAVIKTGGIIWNALAIALLQRILKRSALSWITALI